MMLRAFVHGGRRKEEGGGIAFTELSLSLLELQLKKVVQCSDMKDLILIQWKRGFTYLLNPQEMLPITSLMITL